MNKIKKNLVYLGILIILVIFICFCFIGYTKRKIVEAGRVFPDVILKIIERDSDDILFENTKP